MASIAIYTSITTMLKIYNSNSCRQTTKNLKVLDQGIGLANHKSARDWGKKSFFQKQVLQGNIQFQLSWVYFYLKKVGDGLSSRFRDF